VVFAYHDVGVRCLSVLLAYGVRVPLVVTHEDDPKEQIWFASVRKLAELHGIPVVTPEDPNAGDLAQRVAALKPDFLFSFYYRFMLGGPFLQAPSRGALNMHGSLLPKFRGRVPVNWAIIHGERQTGASLHYMQMKPDAHPAGRHCPAGLQQGDARRGDGPGPQPAAAGARHRGAAAAGPAGRQLLRPPPSRGRTDRLEQACLDRAQPDPRRGAALSGRLQQG
jgi:hypothetical protein